MNVVQRMILSCGMLVVALNAIYAPRVHSTDISERVSRAWILDDDFRRADLETIEFGVTPQLMASWSFEVDGVMVTETWNPVELDEGKLLATTIAGIAITVFFFSVAGVGNMRRREAIDS